MTRAPSRPDRQPQRGAATYDLCNIHRVRSTLSYVNCSLDAHAVDLRAAERDPPRRGPPLAVQSTRARHSPDEEFIRLAETGLAQN